MSIRVSVTFLLAPAGVVSVAPPAVAEDDQVGVNRRISDILGPDGVPDGLTIEDCLLDDGCDDDPKQQNEPSAIVAPWDRDVLLAAFNDASQTKLVPGVPVPVGSIAMGFALSDNGGSTWLRFDHAINPCDVDCDPALDCFVSGHSITLDDLGVNSEDPANPCFSWIAGWQSDPATAAGGENYFYLTGLDFGTFPPGPPFFARLQWTDPIVGWAVTHVPGQGIEVPDKSYVAADPINDAVYVHWSTASATLPKTIRLSASLGAGCDFFDPPLNCPPGLPPVVEARNLAFRDSAPCDTGACFWGSASVVHPDGSIHIIWNQRGGASDPATPPEEWVDQIRYRRGDWVNGDLEFSPPLPDSAMDLKCDPPMQEEACEKGIVFGQPGYPEGYRNPSDTDHLVRRSTNMRFLDQMSIAVDFSDPADDCGRGGYLYVVYAAEEPPEGDPDWEVCDPTRTIDSNIYLVRSRDGGATWSVPARVPVVAPTDPISLPETCTAQEDPVPCGRHFPLQIMPWVAVDGQGRVGVMYYDTTPNTDRCIDDGVVYRIRFVSSLDGGVTWETPLTANDQYSDTRINPLDPVFPLVGVFVGDYAGMSASADEGIGLSAGSGVFHPVWNDLRNWADPHNNPQIEPGDIYTATITLSDPVYSIGDFDRDYDVDMDDFKAIAWCTAQGLPLPPECEILDINRDNVVDPTDGRLMQGVCFSGKGLTSAGSGTPDLSAMTALVNETTSQPDRAELADSIRVNAQAVTTPEAQVMNDFADLIDPQ